MHQPIVHTHWCPPDHLNFSQVKEEDVGMEQHTQQWELEHRIWTTLLPAATIWGGWRRRATPYLCFPRRSYGALGNVMEHYYYLWNGYRIYDQGSFCLKSLQKYDTLQYRFFATILYIQVDWIALRSWMHRALVISIATSVFFAMFPQDAQI